MNIVIARITKTSVIFSVFVLFIGILDGTISLSSFIIVEVQAQKVDESEKKKKKNQQKKNVYLMINQKN